MKMKKSLNLISFLLLCPSLVGCNKPTIHTPSFSSYGKQVNYDYFKIEMTEKSGHALKGIVVSSVLIQSAEFSCVASQKTIKDRTNYSYYQLDSYALINPETQQFRSKNVAREYYQGSIYGNTTDQDQKIPEKKITTIEYYGEVVGEELWRANITEKTAQKLSSPFLSGSVYFQHSAFTSANIDYYFSPLVNPVNSIPSDSSYAYYVNGKTFTVEMKQPNYPISYIYQYYYGRTISLKSKRIETNQDDNGFKSEIYVDFSFKPTNKKIQKVDYSKYSTLGSVH